MPLVRRAGILAVLAGAYFAAGRVGLSLAFVNESATAIWPPSGIAIAACLVWGPQVWPGVLAGAFLVNFANAGAPVPAMLIACGNTSEALLAGLLVRRLAGGTSVFDDTKRIFLFVAVAGAAAAVAATVGLLTLVASGLAADSDLRMTWITWWTGDLAGALLVTPLLITWATRPVGRWSWMRRVEAAVLFAVLVVVCYVVFGPTPAGIRNYPLMFAVLPPLLWAALRLGQRAATLAILVTAVAATVGTLEGYGPFARQRPDESLLLLQAYLCVKMIAMLSLAAEVAARHHAERLMRDLNADLARRTREAEDASSMKDQFLATLSHELRTPLNTIVGWAQLLKEQAPDENLRRRAVEAIQKNVAIQAQLVSDILDISRINRGAAISLERRPLAVASVVDSAAEMVRPVLDAKRIELAVWIPDSALVLGDPQRLQQVFWNLLANAAKFVPQGGHISVSAAMQDRAVQVRVEDDGPGIAEEFLPRIFDQFTQEDSSLTRQFGGLGLGLAISQNIVQLHGGTITAANRPEGGAVFMVHLPAAGLAATVA